MSVCSILVKCIVLHLCSLFVVNVGGLSVPQEHHRVCIIGAGYCGLAISRYLKEFGEDDFTVYEASRHIGGTWRFDPHVGADEDGVPLFTNMYKYLRTNTPRETMEFAGFPFPDGSPSYPAGTCFYRYIKMFVKKFGLMKHIQRRRLVSLVERGRDNWSITYTNTETRNNHTDTCDFLIVANGHYGKPNWPKFKGEEYFKGKIIHSHDYKEPEAFTNRRVLLLGAGPSGLDLATHLVNFTSKLVHSHHIVYNQPDFPKNYVKKPDISMFTSNGVVFQDGSFEEVDDVIYCTGFNFDHSFLNENCGVTCTDKFILPLYQQIVNIRHPSMMFLGFAKATTTRLLDAQAEYAAALITGKFKLPAAEDMLKAWLSYVYFMQASGKKIVDVNVVGKAQDEYFGNLTAEAGIARVPKVITEMRDYNAKIRLDDLLHYRDYDFKIIDDNTFERFYNPRKDTSCTIEEIDLE